LEKAIEINGETFYYYDLSHFEQVSKLPFSVRVLLESALRNCDGGFHVKESDVLTILDWVKYKGEGGSDDKEYEIPFKPSRVILQDFTGVPAGKFAQSFFNEFSLIINF
jgi:aconitate hydratase